MGPGRLVRGSPVPPSSGSRPATNWPLDVTHSCLVYLIISSSSNPRPHPYSLLTEGIHEGQETLGFLDTFIYINAKQVPYRPPL